VASGVGAGDVGTEGVGTNVQPTSAIDTAIRITAAAARAILISTVWRLQRDFRAYQNSASTSAKTPVTATATKKE
jgi:hypothetical protein